VQGKGDLTGHIGDVLTPEGVDRGLEPPGLVPFHPAAHHLDRCAIGAVGVVGFALELEAPVQSIPVGVAHTVNEGEDVVAPIPETSDPISYLKLAPGSFGSTPVSRLP
jgi:hypothetical protein